MFELAAISVVLLLFAVAGIVWDIASGLLVTGVDGILLMAVCLMMAGVFTLELYFVGRQTGWVPAFGAGKAKNAPQPSAARAVSAKAATPAAAVTTPTGVAPAPAPSVAAKPPTAPGVPSAAPPTVPEPATEQPKPEPSS